MPLAHLSFYSSTLGLYCQADVILPQRQQGVGQAGSAASGNLPVLWLLHGGSDDHTIWQRRTSIERYVAPLGLAVVMPAVQVSYYTNMVAGGRYFDYVADELPALMREFFHFSARREDNFVAGLSMGGYGAFKLALTYPERYAAAASLSGVLDMDAHYLRRSRGESAQQDPQRANQMRWIFGDVPTLRGTEHDLFHLLQQRAAEQAHLPALYVNCGTEDFLYADNQAFREYAKGLGVDFTYYEEPGEHEWGYWDRNIQRVLDWLPLTGKP